MSVGKAVFDLPGSVARSVTDFLFSPALGANPDRLASWVPSQLDVSSAGTARKLADLLGEAESVLEPAQPLHQIALLPGVLLAKLARRIAVDTLGWALRQVVRRDDLERLTPLLTAQDWDRVYQAAVGQTTAQRRLGDFQVLIDDLPRVGWYLLESVSDSMPRPVGLRLLLKCPVVESPRLVTIDANDAWASERIADSYRSWVAGELPDWEAALGTLTALKPR